MYSFVNVAIPLSIKGKNAERQVLSDVVSAMDWQTIGDSVRSYRYQYNRLIRITNHAADTPAYKDAMYYVDGADLDTERTYDANGNMTSNADSRISRISYDALNMPCRIDYIDGSHIDYTYAADGVKHRVDYYLNPYTSSLPDDDFGTACDSSLLVHTWREYAGNCVYVCDTLSMILIDGGYITFDYTTHQPIYHYYLKDYLGNNRITVSLADGHIEEVNHYYPYGALMGDSPNTGLQPYKYIGKELDRTHGLDWYDHGARHYDPVTGKWNTMDKLCEKYYGISPYASCGDDPVNAVDPNGMDWYRDRDNTWQFDPNVHSQEDLGKGQIYKGESFSTGKGDNLVNYRADGSILYANETMAYNRIWSQASVHYRNQGEKGGREVGAFLLTNGKVLVMPDYKNTSMESYIGEYGYKIGYGTLTKGRETFRISGQIHTHQERKSNVKPSIVYDKGFCDVEISRRMGCLPIFSMGHDGRTYGIYAVLREKVYYADIDIKILNKNLFNGKINLALWAKHYRNTFLQGR